MDKSYLKRILSLMPLVLFGSRAFGQKNISGEYKTNISTYGMLGKN
jgi:hypothetical protein